MAFLASAASAQAVPAPGTWGLGWHGVGVISGLPLSVHYVATEKTSFELTTGLLFSRYINGPSVSRYQLYGMAFEVRRLIASQGAIRLDGFIRPGFAYGYNTSGSSYRDRTQHFTLATGLNLAYFPVPDFSFSSNVALLPSYSQDKTEFGAGPAALSFTRSVALVGEALNVNYYFGGGGVAPSPPGGSAEGSRPGAWALGWQGIGTFFWQPSLKRVVSDKTAFEVVPTFYRVSETNIWSSSSRRQTYALSVDYVRRLSRHHGVTLSALLEPGISYGYDGSVGFLGTHAKTTSWTFSLGAGLEAEYFVLPNLSVGGRTLLKWTNGQTATYADYGRFYQVYNALSLDGHSMSVRWYFGGKDREGKQ